MGIPHEPASLFVYALLAVSGWAIWRGSRPAATPTNPDAGDTASTVDLK